MQARERAYDELLQRASEYQKTDRLEAMCLPPGPRLGDIVVEAQALQKGFNGRLLVRDLTFQLPPGGELSFSRFAKEEAKREFSLSSAEIRGIGTWI